MLGIIFTIAVWAVFITVYVRHKRKVREFTKLNPNVLNVKNNDAYSPPNNQSLDKFLNEQNERISSPAYDYLACNINFDSRKH